MKRCLLVVTLMLGCGACGRGADAVTAFYAIEHNPPGSDWGITKVELHLYFAASPSCDDVLDMPAPQATIYLEPSNIDEWAFKAKEATYDTGGWVYDFDQMMLVPAVKQRSSSAKFQVTVDRSPEFVGANNNPQATVKSADDALVGSFSLATIDGTKTAMHTMPFVARHCSKLEPKY